MIQFVLAVVLANPCLTPHVHKHHTVTPVQSCVAPVVPMCFKDPVPDPEITPVPQVLPYYIDQVEAIVTADDEPISLTYAVDGIPVTGYSVGVSYPAPPYRTPEISAVGTMPALTLLLGAIAVLKKRS